MQPFRNPDEATIRALLERTRRIAVVGLWLQLGCIDEAGARRARDAGLAVVMDR